FRSGNSRCKYNNSTLIKTAAGYPISSEIPCHKRYEVVLSQSDTPNCSEHEVDIRQISANTAERLTLQAYETLRVNESLILLNDDDPHQLHETLEGEFAGSFSWETLTTDQGEYRIRMTKRATTAMPRIVADTTEIVATAGAATGSVWQL